MRPGSRTYRSRQLASLKPTGTSLQATIVRVVRELVHDIYATEPITYPLMPASGPMYDLCQMYGTPASPLVPAMPAITSTGSDLPPEN